MKRFLFLALVGSTMTGCDPGVTAWAEVSNDAQGLSIRQGYGALNVRSPFKNQYVVTFDQDVNNCAYHVTMSYYVVSGAIDQEAITPAADNGGTANEVLVFLETPTGLILDQERFFLTVVC